MKEIIQTLNEASTFDFKVCMKTYYVCRTVIFMIMDMIGDKFR